LGDKEIIISQEAQSVVESHLSKVQNGPKIVSVGEQPEANAITVKDKIMAQKDAWFTSRAESMQDPVAPETPPNFSLGGYIDQNVDLSSEQIEAIVSGKGGLFFLSEQDGVATFRVVKVDGVDKISVQSPIHLEMAASEAQPTVSVDEANGVYKIGMQTANEKPLTVVIDPNNPNGAHVFYESKKVTLDTYTAEQVENVAETALKDKGVNTNIKLNNPLTQKFVHQVENFRVKQFIEQTMGVKNK
jgi:hypothetical protein